MHMVSSDMLATFRILIGKEESDELLLFILNSVEEAVLSFCHRTDIPDGLKNTVIRMAVDMYREEQYGVQDGTGNVTSISVGDTSTTFSTEKSTSYVDSLLKNYETTLKHYRKLVVK